MMGREHLPQKAGFCQAVLRGEDNVFSMLLHASSLPGAGEEMRRGRAG